MRWLAGCPISRVLSRSGRECNKIDYRGILAGPEGISGKKAVGSETMTVKN